MDVLCAHVAAERAKQRQKLRDTNARLKQTYAEKSELNANLRKITQEKNRLYRLVKQYITEKSVLKSDNIVLQEKLQKAYDEKAERGRRIKDLERQLQNSSIKSRIKRLLRRK